MPEFFNNITSVIVGSIGENSDDASIPSGIRPGSTVPSTGSGSLTLPTSTNPSNPGANLDLNIGVIGSTPSYDQTIIDDKSISGGDGGFSSGDETMTDEEYAADLAALAKKRKRNLMIAGAAILLLAILSKKKKKGK